MNLDFINLYLPTYQKWLNQPPPPQEVKFNTDGSQYIPIEYIKPKLDYISPTWGTKNFNHFPLEMPVFDRGGSKIGTTIIFSGSVELDVHITEIKRTRIGDDLYNEEPYMIHRTITGSATFDIQKYHPNTNWGQTCLSLCIVAAAKELGAVFGKDLNKEVLTIPTINEKSKKSPIVRAMNEVTKNLQNRP